MRAAGSLRWWETAPSWFSCFHPVEQRYMFFPDVEQCGYCAACRRITAPEDRNAFWPPLTRPQHYEWADTPSP